MFIEAAQLSKPVFIPLSGIKFAGIRAHSQNGIGPKRLGMLGQLFQGIIPGLSNHVEIARLLAAKEGADTTEKIADEIAGPDTRAVDRSDDPDHTHVGAVVDGEDEDRFLFCGHKLSMIDGSSLSKQHQSVQSPRKRLTYWKCAYI